MVERRHPTVAQVIHLAEIHARMLRNAHPESVIPMPSAFTYEAYAAFIKTYE